MCRHDPLADELRDEWIRFGQPVVRVSIDDYEHPRAERYRQGAESAPAYYHDSFDFQVQRDRAMMPLGPGGTHLHRQHLFNLAQHVGETSSLTTSRRRTPLP